jgi:hypothetical protein
MRYRLIALLLVVVVAATGCGAGTTSGARQTATAASHPVPSPTPTLVPVTTTSVRRAGINTMPGMRPWRYYGPNPDSWWCVVPNCVAADPAMQIATEMGWAKQLGVTYLRVEFDWPLIEPQQGQFDWSRADLIVHTAAQDGLQLAPVLVFSPKWAATCAGCAPPAQAYASFVSAVVSRYKSSVHVWELWNEPDGFHYWDGTEQQYVSDVLVPGYTAAHTADPATAVELGAPSYANRAWLNTIYDDGGGNSFDIMGWHDYGGAGQILGDARVMEGVLQAHGQANKPLWLGEFGVQELNVNDTAQQYLLKTVLTAQNSPIAVAMWYNLRDDSAYNCCPPMDAKDASWGLVTRDGVQRQGFALLQQLIAAGLPRPQLGGSS